MRPISPADLSAVLELNQRWVPSVGSLTESSLEDLLDCASFTAAEFADEGTLCGFVIVLGPGANYASPNYRFFADRHESFTYVDRVAVNPDMRQSGLGTRLYRATAQWAIESGSPVVCCEVNLEPANPDSMAFHERLGFTEVGTQWTYDHTVRVRMLECASDRVGQ